MDNHQQQQKPKPNLGNSLSLLLSCNPKYSRVLSLSTLLEEISSINLLLKHNIQYITALNHNDSTSSSFNDFLSKTILCFNSTPQIDYNAFLSQVQSIDQFDLNSELTLLNLLADALLTTVSSDSHNLCQCTGVMLSNISNNNINLLKVYTNRLINTKHFELLRLHIGDFIMTFIFRYCSMFIFDNKADNYLQVLGPSLKDIIGKMFNIPSKLNNKYCFNKLYTSTVLKDKPIKMNSNNNSNNKYNKPIPANTSEFNVERKKIYYCPYFNKKLNFFRIILPNPNVNPLNNDNSGNSSNKKHSPSLPFDVRCFKSMGFDSMTIIPIDIKNKIMNYLHLIENNIRCFNSSFELFRICPVIKGWQEIKKEIKQRIKIIQTTTTTTDEDAYAKNENYEKLMDILKQLINTHIPYTKVFNFIVLFLKKILPKDFIGVYNFKVLLRKVNQFVTMNRYEHFNRVNLFDNKEFSFSEMKWLEFKKMSNKKYSNYGILLKNHIMKSIIHFIFDVLIVNLVRSHFFVTEKQGDHFRTFYFHKTIYAFITKICYVKYTYVTNQYIEVKKEDAFDSLKAIDSTAGRLRLMPKPSSMRPITSFKKKTWNSAQTITAKLFDTQKIFKHIQNKMQRNTRSCVVFDYKEIIKRLINIKLRLIKTQHHNRYNVTNRKLDYYLSYCTMDIEACYDNIDINLLNKFLETDTTISNTYLTGVLYILIPRLNKIKEQHERNKITYNKQGVASINCDIKDCFNIKLIYMVSDLNDYIHILDYIQRREDINYSNCIVYLDTTSGINYLSKAQFIPTVRNIINNNFIVFDRKMLKQIKGIPQGLSVSSFLCNLFFYEVERKVVYEIQNELTSNTTTLLLRFMDDYLCLSSSENEVLRFKQNAIELSNNNKFNFNLKKSQSNIQIDSTNVINLITATEQLSFSWNGIFFRINSYTFFNLIYDVKIPSSYITDLNEYKKLLNMNLPIVKNIKDFSWLVKKINSTLCSGHPWIYFLSTINEVTVLENNLKLFIKFFLYKLIVIVRKTNYSVLQPSQNTLINVLDSSISRMFAFFDSKIFELEKRNFFIPYTKFHKVFYVILFSHYLEFTNKENEIQYNNQMIKLCPLLFKSIRRKIERFGLVNKVNVIDDKFQNGLFKIDEIKKDVMNKTIVKNNMEEGYGNNKEYVAMQIDK